MSTPKKWLTPEDVVDDLCEIIANTGVTYQVACQSKNLPVRTYFRWMQKGREQATGRYRRFADRVTEALAEFEVRKAEIVADASLKGPIKTKTTVRKTPLGTTTTVEKTENPPDWKAALTMLERRIPERWASQQKTDVEIKDMTPPKVSVVFVEPPDYEPDPESDPDDDDDPAAGE